MTVSSHNPISENRFARADLERKDSIRLVEVFVGASQEFFTGRKKAEIKEFFEYALAFLKENQREDTIISAVVHLDEATPHMHVSFVPLTEDNRLCAKEINRLLDSYIPAVEQMQTQLKKYIESERN
uniref:plasmid recombination protein n=1 Tax=Agathobacter sp. TaxID=2021311 RepID=UPI00405777F7